MLDLVGTELAQLGILERKELALLVAKVLRLDDIQLVASPHLIDQDLQICSRRGPIGLVQIRQASNALACALVIIKIDKVQQPMQHRLAHIGPRTNLAQRIE